MAKRTNTRPTKLMGEMLSTISGHPAFVRGTILPPGLRDEPRQLLSFILRLLDGKHHRMVRQHLQFFLRFDLQIRTPKIDSVLRRMGDDPTLLDSAADGMILAMRELADMWIDSGKSRNDEDVDNPADRNVEDVLRGRVYSLFQMIDRTLLRSYLRYTTMRRDGSQTIEDTYPRFEPGVLYGLKDSFKEYGEKWAAYYFSALLNTRYSRHISRCDQCKAYFAYERARLREVKHGVFCPACDGKASVKRTEISRTRRLDTAAKAWIEWESRCTKSEQWQWVVDRVNAEHGTAFGRRWVSQNSVKIQERVEALRNAKG